MLRPKLPVHEAVRVAMLHRARHLPEDVQCVVREHRPLLGNAVVQLATLAQLSQLDLPAWLRVRGENACHVRMRRKVLWREKALGAELDGDGVPMPSGYVDAVSAGAPAEQAVGALEQLDPDCTQEGLHLVARLAFLHHACAARAGWMDEVRREVRWKLVGPGMRAIVK